MIKALIDSTNSVVNVIVIEPDAVYTPPAGLTLAGVGDDPGMAIGGTYDPTTGVFTPPPPPDAPVQQEPV